jgi:hypothetical protein
MEGLGTPWPSGLGTSAIIGSHSAGRGFVRHSPVDPSLGLIVQVALLSLALFGRFAHWMLPAHGWAVDAQIATGNLP